MEVFSPQGASVGKLKKLGMTILKYTGYDPDGTKLFTRKAKGAGVAASKFNFDVKGHTVASINSCKKESTIKKIMGDSFYKI
jgi:hypothetical protein